MIRNITVGIDVGTYSIKVAISEHISSEPFPRIIGTGASISRGVRHGYIVDSETAIKSIRRAITDAEKMAGIKVKKAFVSIGGIGLSSVITTGTAVISKADGEVTALDVKKAIDESEQAVPIVNKKILHIIPLSYKLDGKEVLGKPEGMKGQKLEVRTIFVTCLESHFEELVTVVTEAGVDVIEVVAGPIASSVITLSDAQKIAGCLLVDIGAETVSLAVFENNTLIGLHVISIGSSDISKDIALGFQISLDEAEGIKIGSILGNYSKKKLDEIIQARFTDIFELIDNYLKKMRRNELLPAGVIITGGGAHSSLVDDIARSTLKLPAKVASSELLHATKNKIKDSTWFTVYGLCFPRGAPSASSTALDRE